MKDLATEKYWTDARSRVKKGKASGGWFRNSLKHATRDYANEFLLKETLLAKTIPKGPLKTLEVGCAPGGNLIYFNKEFGHDVYGVEYTPDGVETVRERFVSAGLDPTHVIEADFFNARFQAENKGQYDFVFSEGFIEHFDNPRGVVQAHLDLVKSGGHVFILIPNLSGINKFFTRLLHSTALSVHNTSIMNKPTFSALFPKDTVDVAFCGYLGMFTFGLFPTDTRLRYGIYRFLQLVQRVLNAFFRIVFRRRPLESRYWSAYLVFVGKVK